MPLRFRKSSVMGAIHKSKPVTEEDKHMSVRHKNNRKNIETIDDDDEKLHESNSYNENHAREHIEQIKKNNRQILNKDKKNKTVEKLLSMMKGK